MFDGGGGTEHRRGNLITKLVNHKKIISQKKKNNFEIRSVSKRINQCVWIFKFNS